MTRRSSVSRLDENSNSSNDTSNSDDSSSDNSSNEDHHENGGKVRKFFKNLIHFTKRSKSIGNLNTKKEEKPSVQKENTRVNHNLRQNPIQIEENDIGEVSLPHPFLTVKNKDSNLFEEYRKNAVKTQEDFRALFKDALQWGKFEKVLDFYCWIFSKSANLIELLVNEKYSKKSNDLNGKSKKNDASFYVSTNWRFMKEIYSCLTKLVFLKSPIFKLKFLN